MSSIHLRKVFQLSHRTLIRKRVGFSALGYHCSAAIFGNVNDKMLPLADDTKNDLLFKHTRRPKTVSVIGAPMTYGQPYIGTDKSPTLLRESDLFPSLCSIGWRLHDTGDLNYDQIANEFTEATIHMEDSNAKNSQIVGKGCEMLANVVEKELGKGRFPLIIGGDHSIGVGSLAGILRSRPDTGVIWVDAHADLNTPCMSESGNMHGMPIGLILDGLLDDPSRIPGFEWMGDCKATSVPRLKPDSIVYVGLRDVDAEERRVIREKNITAFTMHEIDRYGIGQVMDLALSHLLEANENRPIHVSYDIDAVDPLHAPATGTAVRGGLTYREAYYVAEAVARSGTLASVEIVELNPTLSNANGAQETVDLGVGIVTSLMGKSII